MNQDVILKLEDIRLERGERLILENTSLEIRGGEHWLLLGRNGSGKTTLFHLIYGRIWPTSGQITFSGQSYGSFPLRDAQARMGVVETGLQDSLSQKNLTVSEVLLTGWLGTLGLYGDPGDAGRDAVHDLLAASGWLNRADSRWDTLSSGEKLKFALLRAQIRQPELLLLDEPAARLDYAEREVFLEMLAGYFHTRPQVASLMTLHRLEDIPPWITHTAFLHDGRIIADGARQSTLNDENFRTVFGLPLPGS